MTARAAILWLWKLGTPGSPLPVLAIGAAILFFLQLQRPIYDVDIFWQLKLGEMTLTKGLPATEPFLAGKEDVASTYIAWFGQVVYAIMRWIGGWPLLRLVDALIWFSGLYLVARYMARRGGNDWPALTGLIIGWIAAIPHASIRPQTWAMPALALLVILIKCDWSGRRKLYAGSLLLVVWQNLHPSLVFALAYLGIQLLFAWYQAWNTNLNKPWWLVGLTAAGVAAYFATPDGTQILEISKYNTEISKERGITEWFPMWWRWLEYGRDYAWTAFGLTLLVFIFVFYDRMRTGRWRITVADAVVLLVFTAAALWMHRFVMMWSVVVIPVISNALAVESGSLISNRWRSPIAFSAALLAILPPVIAKPAPFWDYYPFKAVAALKQHGFQGVIYCDYLWGGVIIDSGYPDWKVTHDGRYYLFTVNEWRRYDDWQSGQLPLETLLKTYRPGAFILRRPHGDGLISQLRESWQIIFEDTEDRERSIVFIRKLP